MLVAEIDNAIQYGENEEVKEMKVNLLSGGKFISIFQFTFSVSIFSLRLRNP